MTNSLAVSSSRIASTQRMINPWHEVPDQQLVEFCLHGMEEAWVELLRRYHRLIIIVLIRTIPPSLHQAGTVQDLFQEVLAKVCANSLRALREFEWRHEGSLRGLLQIVSFTVAHDYLRRWLNQSRDVRLELPLDEIKHDSKTSNPHSAIERRILLEQLARCLAQRIRHEPNHTRDIAIFLLYYGYGLRSADMARLYRLNIKTVESKLARFSRLVRLHCVETPTGNLARGNAAQHSGKPRMSHVSS
jgi:RNA polymerase sigma factor (sigma-70 family)